MFKHISASAFLLTHFWSRQRRWSRGTGGRKKPGKGCSYHSDTSLQPQSFCRTL